MAYSFNSETIRESCNTDNKKEARGYLAARRTEIQENRFFPNKRKAADTTLLNFANEYLTRYAMIEKKSWRHDTGRLCHILPFFGEKSPLENIRRDQAAQYREARLKGELKPIDNTWLPMHGKNTHNRPATKVSNAAVNRELSLLISILNKAVEWDRLDANPLSRLKKLKENEPRQRHLSLEEVNWCRHWCKTNGQGELWDRLCLYLNTGFRKKEITSLEWEDLDFDRNVIHLQAKKSKNGVARNAPMVPVLKDILLKRRISRDPNNPLVFPGLKNKFQPSDSRYALDKLRKAAVKAGMKDFFLHDLRRTFAQMAVDAGVDLYTVQHLMGHETLTTTERYLGMNPQKQRRAYEAVAHMMSQNQTSKFQSVEQEKVAFDKLVDPLK